MELDLAYVWVVSKSHIGKTTELAKNSVDEFELGKLGELSEGVPDSLRRKVQGVCSSLGNFRIDGHVDVIDGINLAVLDSP